MQSRSRKTARKGSETSKKKSAPAKRAGKRAPSAPAASDWAAQVEEGILAAAGVRHGQELPGPGDGLGVSGHRPHPQLEAQNEELFRAFQSNLISLISHELRTPLTGVLTALNILEDGVDAEGFSQKELVSIARRNALRLNDALSALLDVAAIEAGTFHVRLREVELSRLANTELHSRAGLLQEKGLEPVVDVRSDSTASPVLGDPQKLGRAIDLCLQIILSNAESPAKFQVRVHPSHLSFSFRLPAGSEDQWVADWTSAAAGSLGGVASPTSAFGGIIRSEREFLTRSKEGLGSEFMLVHEIMRRHRGRFVQELDSSGKVTLTLDLPELRSEEGLRAALLSRIFETSTSLDSVALVLVAVPASSSIEDLHSRIRSTLFRSSDAAYPLPGRGQVAVIMDDCKAEDLPRLLSRIEKGVGMELSAGFAHCPEDAADPDLLIELAGRRLGKKK